MTNTHRTYGTYNGRRAMRTEHDGTVYVRSGRTWVIVLDPEHFTPNA